MQECNFNQLLMNSLNLWPRRPVCKVGYNSSSIIKYHLMWCQVAAVAMVTAQALYCLAEAAWFFKVVELFPVAVSWNNNGTSVVLVHSRR